MRSRKKRRNRYFPVMESTPLDLTPEEVLADLDPGWAGWEPREGPEWTVNWEPDIQSAVDSLCQKPARGLQVA